MPQCGEIVVERLTGNRAMVIRVLSPEEVTCRFGDGRLEDRLSPCCLYVILGAGVDLFRSARWCGSSSRAS